MRKVERKRLIWKCFGILFTLQLKVGQLLKKKKKAVTTRGCANDVGCYLHTLSVPNNTVIISSDMFYRERRETQHSHTK